MRGASSPPVPNSARFPFVRIPLPPTEKGRFGIRRLIASEFVPLDGVMEAPVRGVAGEWELFDTSIG
jgi:hypothetical protein